MTVYARTLDRQPGFTMGEWKNFLPLSEDTGSAEVYYYDRHDRSMRNIEFEQCVDEQHWRRLRQGSARLIINYSDDYFNIVDLTHMLTVLKSHSVDPGCVYWLVMDPLWERFVLQAMERTGYTSPVQSLPLLANRAVRAFPRRFAQLPQRKYSILSRNYRPWRLEFYLRLRSKGILEQSYFSFHNWDPYGRFYYTHEQLHRDARQRKLLSPANREWIDSTPWDIGSVTDKYNSVTYDVIQASDIHLLIESHWDPYMFDALRINEGQDYTPRQWAPAFATEKFYKAILLARPTLPISTPWFWQDLAQLGYDSYTTLFDYKFDSEESETARLARILRNIDSIESTPRDEYLDRLSVANTVAQHNRVTFLEWFRQPKLTGEFHWMRSLVDATKLPPQWFT